MNRLVAFTVIAIAAIGAFGAAPTRGLIAYYPFDGDAQDKSGNRNHGVMHGTRPTADRKGRLNSAMLFGEGNYITVPSSPSLTSPKDQITIAAWVRIGEWCGVWAPIICKGLDHKSDHYRFLGHHGGNTPLSSCQSIDARFENSSMLRGAWHHIALSYDGNMAKTYIDGSIAGLRHSPGTFRVSNDELLIGCDPPGGMEWLLGSMDELRIYNRALSDDEIKAVYEADPPTKTSATEAMGWSVKLVDCNVGSLGEAETVLRNNTGTMRNYPVVSFSNGHPRGATFPLPQCHVAFPGKENSPGHVRFATQTKGTIRIPSAGAWTFCVASDNGAKVKITGKDFADVAVFGNNQIFQINIPSAGDYEVEIIHYDSEGAALLEFSSAKGNWATFDKSAFKLVGDPECEIKMVAPKGGRGAAQDKRDLPADDTCPGCNGEKVKWGRCMKCYGKGYVVKSRTLGGGGTVKENFKCPTCSSVNTPARGKGSGRVRKVCPTCNGEGTVKR